MIRYIVFDFDGTIADTFSLLRKIGGDIANRHSIQINIEEARELGFQKALLKSRFPLWRLPQAILEVKKRLAEQAADVRPVRRIKQVLLRLSKKYRLGILSSNSREVIERFLARNKMGFFHLIYPDSSLFGKHAALSRLRKKYKLGSDELIYVGDEDRDIQAANRAHIRNIAVSWGFNNESALRKAKPTYIVSRPGQLLKLLRVPDV